MTALPIIETQAGDISAYIPTNVISITDGQIFLQSDLFYAGTRPAIDAGASVSRVGGSAQTKAMKKLSGTLRIDLASYRELESFSQFGTDLDASTQAKLNRGRRTVEVLKQKLHQSLTVAEETVILYSLTQGYIDDVPINNISDYEDTLVKEMHEQYNEIMDQITQTKDLPKGNVLKEAVEAITHNFITKLNHNSGSSIANNIANQISN